MSAVNSDSVRAGAAGAGAGGYIIENSLRFNDGDTAKMTRTVGTATSIQIFTFSYWLKRSLGAASVEPGVWNCGGYEATNFPGASADSMTFSSPYGTSLITTQKFRDPSAWYHVVEAYDSTESVAADRANIYINGTKVTSFITETYPSLNLNCSRLGVSGNTLEVGNKSGTSLYDGYMAEFIYCDGTQYAATNFGELNDDGQWVPIDPSDLTFGDEGFWLDFAVAPGTGNGAGTDVSGNTNHLSDTGLAVNDQVPDSPTDDIGSDIGNYCTMNPLTFGGCTLSDGNLAVSNPADKGTTGTFAVKSGKWRYQVTRVTAQSPERGAMGWTSQPVDPDTDIPYAVANTNNNDAYGYLYNGSKVNAGSAASYGDTWTGASTDVIDVFFDADNGTIWFAKNGTLQNSASEAEVEAGTTTNAAYSSMSFDSTGGYATPFVTAGGGGTGAWLLNFGQHAYANSYSGITLYKNLHTANLPAPAVTDSTKFYQTDRYTGTGSELVRTLTDGGGSAFKPDFVWMKNFSSGTQNALYDSVRGATKLIYSDDTAAELTVAQALKSFDSSGFTLGTSTTVNDGTPHLFAAWCWNTQGGAGSSNEDGSINTTSTSVGTTQGFSISKYTGTGVAATVGHGLGVAPDLIYTKNLADANAWGVYHSSNTAAPETDYLVLNTTAATADLNTYWNDTAPTTSVFSIGTITNTNGSSDAMVAYCWAEVEGFSKFGIYTGNGNADGPFIWCGFRPAYFMMKSVGVEAWYQWDNKRVGASAVASYNVITHHHVIDNTPVPGTSGDELDILSNGVKFRGSNAGFNGSGTGYLFCAWAEAPFGGDGVAQARAR